MQITRQTEYAIRTILELARSETGELLSTRVISERQDIPEDFLKKTIQLLNYAGLVSTQRGVQGGVRLAKDPHEITLVDIITAIEGPIAINVCLAPDFQCPNRETCVISPLLARAQHAFLQELRKETLADLAAKG
ncbi:MAG: Rrf2 family transcriptional regulator [Bacillota bacterium]|nr:Rrf2 family transcriptional regulator [Bacillota bacterium]